MCVLLKWTWLLETSPLKPSIDLHPSHPPRFSGSSSGNRHTWGLGTSKSIWPTDLASAQGLWCHVKGRTKPTIHRKPLVAVLILFFFWIPGRVSYLFSKGKQKHVFPIWRQNEILKHGFLPAFCEMCILRNQFVAILFMVAKGQSLMGDSWFADLGGWQFGTTSPIWWIFGAIRVCESEVVEDKETCQKEWWDGSSIAGWLWEHNSFQLAGGVKYLFLFSPLFGEDSHFDSYFSIGFKPPTRQWL